MLAASIVAWIAGFSALGYASLVGSRPWAYMFGGGRYSVIEKIVFVVTDSRVTSTLRVTAVVSIIVVIATSAGIILLGRLWDRRRLTQISELAAGGNEPIESDQSDRR